MRLRASSMGLAFGLAFGLHVVITASAQEPRSLNVVPTMVAPGGTVTVSGNVGAFHNGIALCSSVTLSSGAFFDQGRDTVETGVSADGRFSTKVRISPSIAPGSYTVDIERCGPLFNLGRVTLIVAPGLPATGDGSSHRAGTGGTPAALLTIIVVVPAAAGLVALGVWARRRRSA